MSKTGKGSVDTTSESYARVVSLLGQEGLERIFADIDQPSGMPSAAYCDPDWLKIEHEKVFAPAWNFAAADGELPEPGSVKPLEIAGQPVFLVRGEDLRVRAFHNVCRHRGTMLIDTACRKRAITCPYHAWKYGLDGRLLSRPYFHGPTEIERFGADGLAGLDLLSIRCEQWQGCYFVDLSGSAPPLDQWLGPILSRTRGYDFSEIRWIAKRSYAIKSNWKLVLENYMEGYHVFKAHPRLIAHAPMEVRWSGEWLGDTFYNDYLAPKLTPGRGDALPHYTGLSEEDRRRGFWFACLPNFAVEVYADQFVILATYPVAPDLTLEELHFFVVGENAATGERYAAAREELINMWDELNLEDVNLLERLQRGRRSTAFPGSMMSPAWEGPSHELGQKIIHAILA